MHRLVPIEARGSTFVEAMRAAWDAGDAVLPIDPRLPAAAARALTSAMTVDVPVAPGTALVVPTSGTTGRPKGVVLSHDAVTASAAVTAARVGAGADAHWLACLPLAHVGGLSVVTRALHTGAALTVHDHFDPAATDALGAGSGTHVSLVATALRRIDPSRWRCIVLGGSAPPPDRPPNAVATYGLTETGSGVVYDGVPLPGVEVRVEQGELWLRGPMIATTYRDGTPVVDAEGWLHTGDEGAVVDGRVEVRGRRGDLIISGGENVWPEPVERRLAGHPAVEGAAVIGRSDPEWGQRVVAVIEVAAGHRAPGLEELRDWVRGELPAWCAPKELVVVDVLPRTALGKVRRGELR